MNAKCLQALWAGSLCGAVGLSISEWIQWKNLSIPPVLKVCGTTRWQCSIKCGELIATLVICLESQQNVCTCTLNCILCSATAFVSVWFFVCLARQSFSCPQTRKDLQEPATPSTQAKKLMVSLFLKLLIHFFPFCFYDTFKLHLW